MHRAHISMKSDHHKGHEGHQGKAKESADEYSDFSLALRRKIFRQRS
jgi:hypothetical protein